MKKLAIVVSHPIQYYSPWFNYLTKTAGLTVKVFYLWNFGVTKQIDFGFQQEIQWDIPLLSGYDYEFVPNISSDPGTHHFWGLQNPSLSSQIKKFNPEATLLMIYNYASIYRFLWSWNQRQIPLLFRGDSHRLLESHGVKALIKRAVITQIYHRFAACLYVGKANYDYFRHHRVAEKQLFFSPHAVDNHRFLAQSDTVNQQAQEWKKELGIPADHLVILFAGKLEEKKRPLDLLKAFLSINISPASLLFVGAGPLETELKNTAARHPNVYFAPFQNQTLMPRTYAAADLFVLPSYGAGETWGLAINEAMCLGRPVIVSNHVGCYQDLVHSYQNGLIFPSGDISALARSLQEALSNRERLQKWGDNSRNIVAHYTYNQTTQGLIQALEYAKQK
ncbi:glycosyltransferase family 4 protein [Anabaena sp. UHCC 0399]|uniref:glycosyltransferase family 4 protein n=1 Tax=Anabaena sp. UHCC 0399 TaxID=3110238 RepID=UPI002B1EE8D9|nr:glycosyltransferase family 4 protein [Anabaena sp. UHCC 0399]MEA5566125.1 glycosyltransferase family 4 protein [Anabaena sp. UHCC 0399]